MRKELLQELKIEKNKLIAQLELLNKIFSYYEDSKEFKHNISGVIREPSAKETIIKQEVNGTGIVKGETRHVKVEDIIDEKAKERYHYFNDLEKETKRGKPKKQKICIKCNELFSPNSPAQKVCSIKCGLKPKSEKEILRQKLTGLIHKRYKYKDKYSPGTCPIDINQLDEEIEQLENQIAQIKHKPIKYKNQSTPREELHY